MVDRELVKIIVAHCVRIATELRLPLRLADDLCGCLCQILLDLSSERLSQTVAIFPEALQHLSLQ